MRRKAAEVEKKKPPLRSALRAPKRRFGGGASFSTAYRFGTGVLALRIEIISLAAAGTATSRVSTSSLAGILEP